MNGGSGTIEFTESDFNAILNGEGYVITQDD